MAPQAASKVRMVVSALAVAGVAITTTPAAAHAAAPSAAAAPSSAVASSAAVAAAARVPACIKVSHTVGLATQTVYVRNRCRWTTVSFVVRRVGPDSPCFILRPHHYRSYKWARYGAFQGIRWNCT
jgi:hypothetical protein